MTSQGVMQARNSGIVVIIGRKTSIQSNMATVVVVLCRLLDVFQTNEDPRSFQNSCAGFQRFDMQP